WSTSPAPTTTNNKTTLGTASVTGDFTSNLTGLSPTTTYYVRAYAINDIGTAYSDDVTFTTNALPTMASVNTLPNPVVNGVNITIQGEITNLGDGLVTQHGHCYSISQNPNISGSKTELGAKNSLGNFTSQVDGLQQLTTYYIRAYATNSMGTSYGNEISFVTGNAPPIVLDGLIAYYTFDNQDANDYTTDHNGVIQNVDFSTVIPGTTGYSANFNGSSFINIPNKIFSNSLKTWSFNVWIKTSSINSDLFSQDNAYYIFINGNSKLQIYLDHTFDLSLANSLLNNQWHMLTISSSDNYESYYIDGNMIEQKTFYNNFGWAGNSCKIGTNYNASNYFFNGKLDNIRFYNRPLNQTEITEIYNAQQ
ncbi:MAG: LamG domain-containing protein, partial [Bacteroidales bacterium]